MLHFDTRGVATDLVILRAVLGEVLNTAPPEAWSAPSGTRSKDWPLRDVVAHLAAKTGLFNLGFDAACAGEALRIEGMAKRTDLRAWNERQIEARCEQSPELLISELLDELEAARRRALSLGETDYAKRALLPIYNRPSRAIDFLTYQLSHAGVIHAAQITRPLGIAPLWVRYPADMLHRQIARYLLHFSYAYWPEYSQELRAVVNFRVGGPAGGEWHLRAAPGGGNLGVGLSRDASHHITFTSPEAMFAIFTLEKPVEEGLVEREMVVWESDPYGIPTLDLIKLFTPTHRSEG